MFNLKPTHAPVKKYYQTLETFSRNKFDNEGQIRHAFEKLLRACASKFDWSVVPEYEITLKNKRKGRVDAAIVSSLNIKKGYWEAKDSKDDLEAEIKKKFDDGYPRTNILFQSPARAVFIQNGRQIIDADLTNPESLVDVLEQFFAYSEPQIEEWEKSVKDFSARLPEIAEGLFQAIEGERKRNKLFVERFAAFYELCRQSINPDLKQEAVEKMLVQHLLTERIFRKVFDNPDFIHKNVIAAEIEKVISALTSKNLNRDFLFKEFGHYYTAIESTAATLSTYAEKQTFLNTVYERFFQGFDWKQKSKSVSFWDTFLYVGIVDLNPMRFGGFPPRLNANR